MRIVSQGGPDREGPSLLPSGICVWTVSEIGRSVRELLETAFEELWVEGEVSNPKLYPSGHLYFDLKDADSVIAAVMFGAARAGFRFKLEQGLKVLVRARLSSYPKNSKYQLIVQAIEPRAMGALQLAFEQLKAKLKAEGLFEESRKRSLPPFPARIGVVTSLSGAAIGDILSVLKRRHEGLYILIHPVKVQGEGAAGEIAGAIETLNGRFPDLDVLMVGRGGGSLEDLWAFNEEVVARAIAASRIPVISCVGHETDFTIADLVADLRAPTPSAAAELVVRSKEEVLAHLGQAKERLLASLRHRVAGFDERFRSLLRSRVLVRPLVLYEDRARELDDLGRRLLSALRLSVDRSQGLVRLEMGKLQTLSPLAVLSRGYAIAFKVPAGPSGPTGGPRGTLPIQGKAPAGPSGPTGGPRGTLPIQGKAPAGPSGPTGGPRGTSPIQGKVPEERAVRRAAEVAVGDRLRVQVHEGEIFCEACPAPGPDRGQGA